MTTKNDEASDAAISRVDDKINPKELEKTQSEGEVPEEMDSLAELPEDEFDGEEDSEDQDRTLVEILKNPEITRAINTAVTAWAKVQPDTIKLKFRSLHLGIAFSFFVLLAIGILAYLGVLTKEVTGTLIGSLIGYWYGKQQGK